MNETALILILAFAGTAGIGLAAAAALKGWRDWLDVRRLEMGRGAPGGARPAGPGRIELADLRARVRRLEAIANGGE
jgi:hypothetical protein